MLGLRYVRATRPHPGSPSTPLTNPLRIINVPGDGNCLFNALSYYITGSVDQHSAVCQLIIQHMFTIEQQLVQK